jgi:hypothetical protein
MIIFRVPPKPFPHIHPAVVSERGDQAACFAIQCIEKKTGRKQDPFIVSVFPVHYSPVPPGSVFSIPGIKPPDEFTCGSIQRNGMQREQFDRCLARQDLSESIYQTAKQGMEEFGVKSTPTFFVNGRVVRGAQTFAFFQDLIEAELRKAESE